MNRDEQCSLHAIRNEIGQVLRLMPDFALRNVRFQPICSLHVQDLRDIEYRTKKSAKQIFGAVKHLDLRGCMMEYDELKYFSHACSKLSSIAITYAAAFLPNEIFLKHENLKQNKMRSVRPFQKIRNFLQISLPNFAEMEKKGQLPEEHIDLLAKLLKLFPYLQTLQVD
uniref:Uncharacterized protein n=1 Tax=Setaria digitata TaxID=48799 RepID=A0A915PRW2_9BILA